MSAERVVLVRDGDEVRLDPRPVFAVADCDCPSCGDAPLRVQGTGRTIGGHDWYRATGHCAACGARVGEVRAYVSTIFGIEEDERVLHGRARVY